MSSNDVSFEKERSRGTNAIFVMFVIICLVVLIVVVVGITSAISQSTQLADIERALINAIGTIIQQFSLLGVSVLRFFTDLTELALTELGSISTQFAQAFASVADFLRQHIENTVTQFLNGVIKYTANLAQILLQSLTTMGLDFAKVTSHFAAFTTNIVLKLEMIIPQTVAAVATFIIAMFNTVFSEIKNIFDTIIDLIEDLDPFSLSLRGPAGKKLGSSKTKTLKVDPYLHKMGNSLQNMSVSQIGDFMQEIHHTLSTVSQSLSQVLSLDRVVSLL